MKKIKNSHVVVLGSGPSVKKYWSKISGFLERDNVVTFGCNHIMDFLVPDYHFWGSTKRWKKFGHLVAPSTVVVTSSHFPAKKIKEKWKGRYLTFNNVERMWKIGSDEKGSKEYQRCQIGCFRKKMVGCVRDIATWAIFYAYINGAKRISVIGNDGYTLYKEGDLKDGVSSQHCYGTGMTDGYTYNYCRKKDWDKYKTLKLLHSYGLKKYGFSFEIITPTIYDKLYNPNVLEIEADPEWQKWKEPTKEEYYDLYVKSLKGRRLER